MIKSKGFLKNLTFLGLALKVLIIILRVNKLEKDVQDMAATKTDVLNAITAFANDVFSQLDKIETDLAAYQEAVKNETSKPEDLQEVLDALNATKTKLSGAASEIDSKIPERVENVPTPPPVDNGEATTGGDTSTATPGADSGSTASGEDTTSGSTGVDEFGNPVA